MLPFEKISEQPHLIKYGLMIEISDKSVRTVGLLPWNNPD